jgi:hypothetical protein
MTDQEREAADRLIGRIETAVGQLPERHGRNAILIKEILEAANGLRSLIGVVRGH